MNSVFFFNFYCGDVRSRTSYNEFEVVITVSPIIVVTSDLGRVTTELPMGKYVLGLIVVTSDLGRVTTMLLLSFFELLKLW